MKLFKWLKLKFDKKINLGRFVQGYNSYHFGREDYEKGICAESEIGKLVSDNVLKARCIEAEKRNPTKYRLGRFAQNYRETH